jgi:hypothetical protein
MLSRDSGPGLQAHAVPGPDLQQQGMGRIRLATEGLTGARLKPTLTVGGSSPYPLVPLTRPVYRHGPGATS